MIHHLKHFSNRHVPIIHSKYANEKNNNTNKTKAGFSVEKLKSLIDMMQSNLKNWSKPYQFEKHWSEYYSKNIDSEQYLAHKEQVIAKWLKQIQPTTVLDLGANTGKFSMLAANYAQKVIALESDDICVDILEQQMINEKNPKLYDDIEAGEFLRERLVALGLL